MAEIKYLKKDKLNRARSSNHKSPLLVLAPTFLLRLVSIPFHTLWFEESRPPPLVVAPPSFTGQPNRVGSAEEALEVIESMHLCESPKVSAKGISLSHDFRALMESFKLLSTDWEKNLSVFEMRLSSEYSSVISRNSPAQRSGPTLKGVKSILTP